MKFTAAYSLKYVQMSEYRSDKFCCKIHDWYFEKRTGIHGETGGGSVSFWFVGKDRSFISWEQRSNVEEDWVVSEPDFTATSGDSRTDPCDPISGLSSGPLTIEQVPVTVPLGYRFTVSNPLKKKGKSECIPRLWNPFYMELGSFRDSQEDYFHPVLDKIVNRLIKCYSSVQ